MSVEINTIFSPKSQSIWQFLINQGQGCYIPAYQRDYSWGNEQINRLLEEATHGLSHIMSRENTLSFLGAVIAIHDSKNVTVHPIHAQEIPSRVMTIIDGQQRLCTLIMINIAMHDIARVLNIRFKDKSDEHFKWLFREVSILLSELEKTIVIDREFGESIYRYYPRIIRAYVDAWSTVEGQAAYTSPVARIIWNYINFIRDPNNAAKRFVFGPVDRDGRLLPGFPTVVNVYKHMAKELNKLIKQEGSDFELPDVLAFASDNDFNKRILTHEIPSSVAKFISEQSEHSLHRLYCDVLRLLYLAKYINSKMVFTVITTTNEDDAFDMFESLNTTGEPLTAFETFKPKIIQAEGLAKFASSPSSFHVKTIDKYFERFTDAKDRLAATTGVLIPFALAETGYKLTTKLNDQRGYLREQFNLLESEDLANQRLFVSRIAGLSVYMNSAWSRPSNETLKFETLPPCTEDVSVAFEALRSLTHHITIAPLVRFFHDAYAATDPIIKATRADDFYNAIKATAAFSVLWRTAYGGTNNIDNVYRGIMSSGIPGTTPPLALRPKGAAGALSLVNYKKMLREKLSEKDLFAKDKWVKEASKIPVYKHSVPLTRFLLLLASHDVVMDSSNPGLVVSGRHGVSPMLTLSSWADDAYYSVEHIAPQVNAGGWHAGIYDERASVDRLGNLTLMPHAENIILGNRPWNEKKLLYKMYAAKDMSTFDAAKSDCVSAGIEFTQKAEDIFAKSKYLGLCQGLAQKHDEWTIEFIDMRSRCIAGLVWDQLSTWLS